MLRLSNVKCIRNFYKILYDSVCDFPQDLWSLGANLGFLEKKNQYLQMQGRACAHTMADRIAVRLICAEFEKRISGFRNYSTAILRFFVFIKAMQKRTLTLNLAHGAPQTCKKLRSPCIYTVLKACFALSMGLQRVIVNTTEPSLLFQTRFFFFSLLQKESLKNPTVFYSQRYNFFCNMISLKYKEGSYCILH